MREQRRKSWAQTGRTRERRGRVAARGERFHAPQGMRTQRSLRVRNSTQEILRQLGENTGQAQSSSELGKSPMAHGCLKVSLWKKGKQKQLEVTGIYYLSTVPQNWPIWLFPSTIIFQTNPLGQINFQWHMLTSRSFLNDHCKSLWFTNNWVCS